MLRTCFYKFESCTHFKGEKSILCFNRFYAFMSLFYVLIDFMTLFYLLIDFMSLLYDLIDFMSLCFNIFFTINSIYRLFTQNYIKYKICLLITRLRFVPYLMPLFPCPISHIPCSTVCFFFFFPNQN